MAIKRQRLDTKDTGQRQTKENTQHRKKWTIPTPLKKRRRVNLGARKQVAAPYKTFLGVLIVKSDTSLVGDKIKIIFGKGKRLITTWEMNMFNGQPDLHFLLCSLQIVQIILPWSFKN